MRFAASLLVALLARPATADTLAQLKAAVARMTANEPLRATWSADGSVKAAGKLANDTSKRTISATIVDDANGLSVTIPRTLSEKAARGPARDEGALSAIDSIRFSSLVEAIDFREPMLDLLNHAKRVDEKRTVFRGRPARQLTLTLDVPRRKKRNEVVIGNVKVAEDRLHVWVGDDGFPLAAERVRRTKAGFLIFSAESTSRTSYTFGRAGDRLLLTRLESSSAGSALGTKIDEASVQTLSVQ